MVFLDIAVTAVNLNGLIRGTDSQFGSKKLCHGDFFGKRFATVFQPGGAMNQKTSGINFRSHVGQLVLDGLKVTDGRSELLALSGIFQ